MKRTPFKTLFLGALAVILFVASVSLVAAYDWAPPTLPFPSGNPAPPLDTSDAEQLKQGSLYVGSSISSSAGLFKPAVGSPQLLFQNAASRAWITMAPSVSGGALLLYPSVGVGLATPDTTTKLHVSGATRTDRLSVGSTPNSNAAAYFFSNTTTAGRSLAWFSQQSPVPAAAAITGVSISNPGSTAAVSSQAIGLNVTANGTGLGKNIAGYFNASNANPAGKARAIVAVGGIEADAFYLTGGGSLGAGGGWISQATDPSNSAKGSIYLATSTYNVGIGTDSPEDILDIRSALGTGGSVLIGKGGQVDLRVQGNVIVGPNPLGSYYTEDASQEWTGSPISFTSEPKPATDPNWWSLEHRNNRLVCDVTYESSSECSGGYPPEGPEKKYDLWTFTGAESLPSGLPGPCPGSTCKIYPKTRVFVKGDDNASGGNIYARDITGRDIVGRGAYLSEALEVATSTSGASLKLSGSTSGAVGTSLWAHTGGAGGVATQKWFVGLDASGDNYAFQIGGYNGITPLSISNGGANPAGESNVTVRNKLIIGGGLSAGTFSPDPTFTHTINGGVNGTLILGNLTVRGTGGASVGRITSQTVTSTIIYGQNVSAKTLTIQGPSGELNVKPTAAAVSATPGFVITGACTYDTSENGSCRDAVMGGVRFGNISNTGLGVIQCPTGFTLRKPGTSGGVGSGSWAFCTYP